MSDVVGQIKVGGSHDSTVELWTWQFAAALAESVRIAWVIETHHADMYDEVRFYLGDPDSTEARTFVSFNRKGRLHVVGPSDRGSLKSLQVIGHDRETLSVNVSVDWILKNIQSSVGRSRPEFVRSLRMMAAKVSRAAVGDEGGPSEWRNGYLDSDSAVGRRDAYFDAVPDASAACHPSKHDLAGIPEYRFWFLVGAERLPHLAIESSTGHLFGV